jgi:hypothetical protein
MKKFILIFWILISSFLIIEISKKAWVEWELYLLEKKIKPKSFADEPWMEPLFQKLQKYSPRNPDVWFLSGQYYLKKSGKMEGPKDRLFGINEAYRCALNAYACNPFDRFLGFFVNKISRWRSVLSELSS